MGIDQSNQKANPPMSEVDLAMHAIKKDIILEENTFLISDGVPTDKDTDHHEQVMLHSPQIGWRCVHITNVQEHIDAHLCNYWTYTPPQPPPTNGKERN